MSDRRSPEEDQIEIYFKKGKVIAYLGNFAFILLFSIYGLAQMFSAEQLDLSTPSTRWMNSFPPDVIALALSALIFPALILGIGLAVCRLAQSRPYIILAPDRMRYLKCSISNKSVACMDYREVLKQDIRKVTKSKGHGSKSAVVRYVVKGHYGERLIHLPLVHLRGSATENFALLEEWVAKN